MLGRRPSAGEALSRIDDEQLLKGALFQIEPKSKRNLWQYLALTGFRVPRVAVCENHQAPFDFVADAFFRRIHAALVLASRGSGKTRNFALLNLIDSKFRPGTITAHIGAIARQSSWGYEYLRDLLKEQMLSIDLAMLPTRAATVWKNGSEVHITTGSTDTGVTAIRCSRLVLDEIDLWTKEIFEMAQQMVSGDEEHPGQRLMASTRYSEHGLMNELLGEALERHWTLYRWCEWEIAKRCRRCEKQRCPLYSWTNPFTGEKEELCKGRMLRSDGWKPREEVIKDFWSSDTREWAIERLLYAPGVERRIYSAFSRLTHVIAVPDEVLEIPTRIAGVDWGWDQPFAITVWTRSSGGSWYCLDERKEQFVLPEREDEIVDELREKWGQGLVFFCGKDEPQSIARWQQRGVVAFPAVSTRVQAGIRLIARKLVLREGRGPQLYVSDTCPMLAHAFETYHQDRFSRIPQQEDDLNDSTRYAIESGESLGLGTGGVFRA